MNVDASAGPLSLWLENSQLQTDAISVTGTVQVLSYLTDTISGSLSVGAAGAPAFLQIEPAGVDTENVAPLDPTAPATTLAANVTIAPGSELDLEALPQGGAPVNFANSGTIAVQPGGTLVLDDTDNGGTSSVAVHGSVFANTGTIEVAGAVGQATSATLLVDTTGPGSIVVNGDGAPNSTTSLTIDGSFTNQNITLTDATVTVNDPEFALSTPGALGFDVSGGSLTFGDGQGRLVLHQAALTNLDPVSLTQAPDGRNPFTTTIFGFGQGDVIALPGKDLNALTGATYVTAFNAATGLLQVEQQASVAGNPPVILASLTLGASTTRACSSLRPVSRLRSWTSSATAPTRRALPPAPAWPPR